ncbi:hypothetical protein [Dyadobacter sp. CY343]|uniref:hypothetical protein n=1 Tax=Dyadobacter sp. CY343 TaxID=2907299 RepID=UPI001F2ECC56|nr:hypothetical protein [Dyadobacter sp. CY343]MCE7061249.1 hypothetical protein [Dyadobacter sp. CY343]
MIKISINGQEFDLPENWTEVDKKKLPELLRNVFVASESRIAYHNILRVVLGFEQKKWNRLMNQFFGRSSTARNMDASSTALADLLRVLSWMWKSDLTIAPFESFEVDGKDWLLFNDGFRSMSFGELTDAYIHAQAFIKQLIEGEERLNMLVATLCRPKRAGDFKNDPSWNGDDREDYNEHIAQLRSKQIEYAYFEQKVLVLVYFLGSVKNFFSYFDLFENDGTPPVPDEFPGQSMIKNQHLLSEKSIFGNMSHTKKANVHEVFQFLEEHHKDVKAEIERHKQANQN